MKAFTGRCETHEESKIKPPRGLAITIPAQVGGTEIGLDVYHPTRLVQHVLDNSPALRDIYAQRLQTHPTFTARLGATSGALIRNGAASARASSIPAR